MRKLLSVVIVGFILLSGVGAVAINLENNKFNYYNYKNKTNEMTTYNYVNNNEMIINFKMQGFSTKKIFTETGIFEIFNINNIGFTGEIGKPQLPVITTLLAVPSLDLTFNIKDAKISQLFQVGKVYPTQEPQVDSEKNDNSELIINEEFYKQNIDYPGVISAIRSSGKIRDIYFIIVEFYPVQYNPSKGLASVYSEITVSVSWNSEVKLNVEQDFENSLFLGFYKNVFLNWDGFLECVNIFENPKNIVDKNQEDGCDYLIITDPDFSMELEEFVEWKNNKGIITKMVDTTVTGTTSNEIKQFIQDAYNNWFPRPSYVLLVGDDNSIPANYVGGTWTDLYYATVDGSDYYPDIFIGRIPIDTVDEANIVIQKILKYEKTPPTIESFYDNFTVAAYFQDDDSNGYEDRRFVKTSEEVRDFLLSYDYLGERVYCTASYINPTHYNQGTYANGEPLPEELLRPNFAWDGDANDIINAINNGIFILTHRDHGFEDGWGDPYFDSNNIDSLTNGDLLPVVFSLNCLTGKFVGYECFCEKFLSKEDGGCVAIFGATDVSYSGYNDYLCRGMYDAQWPDFDTELGNDEPLYSLGEILNYGKMYMTETWGDPWGVEQLTFELFHCFGDPTMEIWSAFPQKLNATLKITDDNLEIDVECFGEPVTNALVCLNQESGFYVKGYTDEWGTINIDTSTAKIDEEVTIIISAHNYLTYNDTIFLDQPPQTPNRPEGSTTGKSGSYIPFTTTTIDPEQDQIYYLWDWGDGNQTDWLGPYESSEIMKTGWIWTGKGTYEIKVKAKDEFNIESDWSEPLQMDISNSKSNSIFLTKIIQDFSRSYPLLNQLIRLILV